MLPAKILKRIDNKLQSARVMHLKHTDDGLRFQVARVKCRIVRDSRGGYTFIAVNDGACFRTSQALASYIWEKKGASCDVTYSPGHGAATSLDNHA